MHSPQPENLLRNVNFLQLVAGRVAGSFATQMQSIVVAWQIYELTHDPLTLGYVGLAQFIPMAILVLPAGDLADRIDRRWILTLSWLTQCIASGLFLGLTLSGNTALLPFYGVLTLFGVGRAFSGPAMQSFLPLLVPKHQLAKAIAWNASAFQTAVIAGPSLGGAIYLLGPAFAYSLCAILLGIASLLVFLIRGQGRQQISAPGPSAFARFTAGIAYVRGQPIVLGAISLDLFAVLLGGATALLPIYANDILNVGPSGLGMLRSSVAVGAFAMAIWLGRYPIKRHGGAIMFASVAVFGVATIVFALSQSFILSLGALFILGASDMISVYIRGTLIQLATPDEMRGRVSAVNMLFIGASNELGEFESGVTAAWFGTVRAVIFGGAGTLAVVGLWMKWFPALRNVDRLEDASVKD
ncbi:MAG: MFS transporter [Exilibacterium sp.]